MGNAMYRIAIFISTYALMSAISAIFGYEAAKSVAFMILGGVIAIFFIEVAERRKGLK